MTEAKRDFFVDTPLFEVKICKIEALQTALTLILKVIWRYLGLRAKSIQGVDSSKLKVVIFHHDQQMVPDRPFLNLACSYVLLKFN